MTLLPLTLLLSACTPDDRAAEDSAFVDVDDGLGGTAALAEVSAGGCPDDFADGGTVTMTANGEERTVKLILPEDGAEGAPVVFVWHPLGGTASMMVRYLGLNDLADQLGVVFVVPDALESNLFEWDFWNGADNDVTLYDDLRTCLSTELAVDLSRVSTTGMSAGGLWSSWLGVHRADTLATVLAMSGGADPVWEYETPPSQYPALLMYGGEIDTWGGGGVEVDFGEATLNYAAELYADGHFVVLCDHGGGHTIPPEGMDVSAAWLPVHQYGKPSPFVDGDLSGLPDYCAVYGE
jgi:poly(3-hydroxybutyrate) depolymerase